MEVPYIFAILNTLIVLMYVYTMQAFNFGVRGVNYLHTLLKDEPEKLKNDPQTLHILEHRDLFNMRSFVMQRIRVKSIMATAIIVNLINYALYPYDTLLYSWMSYILIIAAIYANFDVFITTVAMYKNRKHVSTICNTYYNLTLAAEQDKKIEETVTMIDKAFVEHMQELDRTEFIKGDKENGKNEK